MLNLVVFVALSLYSVFIIYLLIRVIYYKAKCSSEAPEAPPDGISIIIPFRNEESNLVELINSLKNQDYSGAFEIIFVNDSSTDRSVPIIEQASCNSPNPKIRIVDSTCEQKLLLSSKQQALDKGVYSANYDFVAFTDADMTLHPNWLSSLWKSYRNYSADFVFGHTIIESKEKKILNWLQSFQLEFLMAVAYAFWCTNIKGSCMGNNILISKKAYNAIGGQKAIGYSIVEDRALMEMTLKKGFRVCPVIPFHPTATTYPLKSPISFFYQILRWAKGGFTLNSNLLLIGVLIFIQAISFFASLLLIPDKTVILISVVIFFLYWLFVTITFNKIHSRKNILLFPLFYLFMNLEAIIVPFLLLSGIKISWKNRRI